MFRPDLILDAQKLSAGAASEMAALRRAAESNTVWCSVARAGAAKLPGQRQAAPGLPKAGSKGLRSDNPQVTKPAMTMDPSFHQMVKLNHF